MRAGATSSRVLPRRAALFRADQLLQAIHGGVDDVDGVVRAERLAQDVLHTGTFQHGAGGATGDHTGTGGGRAHHHDASGCLPLDGVGDGARHHRDAEEVLTCFFCTLLDCGGNFLGLAVAYADHALAVTDDDQGGEAEATATLDHLGDTVDGDNALDVLRALVLLLVATVVAVAAPTLVAVFVGIVGGASAVTPFTSRHYAFLPLMFLIVAIRTSDHLHGQRPRVRQRGRGTCNLHGQRR